MRHFLLLPLAIAPLPRCMFVLPPRAVLVPHRRFPLCPLSRRRATTPWAVLVSPVAPTANVHLPATPRASIAPRRVQWRRARSQSAGQVSWFGTDSRPDCWHLRLPSSGDLPGRQPSSRSPLCCLLGTSSSLALQLSLSPCWHFRPPKFVPCLPDQADRLRLSSPAFSWFRPTPTRERPEMPDLPAPLRGVDDRRWALAPASRTPSRRDSVRALLPKGHGTAVVVEVEAAGAAGLGAHAGCPCAGITRSAYSGHRDHADRRIMIS